MNRLCKSLKVLNFAIVTITAGLAAGVSMIAMAADPATPAKPDLARGQAIAAQVCAACHAADGNSAGGAYPKLAGQHADYLVKQLKDFKPQPGGKPPVRNNAIMAGFASALSDQDMINVAAWFASQTPKPGFAHDAKTVPLGQKIWRGGIADKGVPACAACHGPTGQGIPIQYPRLSGQWSEYLVTQLTAFQQGTRNNNEPMHTISHRLSDDEIKAVADYAAGLH
ncbi:MULTISPECIES: c-type cytochrome [Paraburkholderia]|uniref:Cytochrome c553 n=2 Tax=Paraburkholderia tropica TaxID=92647 RepID=A0ABX5MHS6_9BURK|nr:MULTISPECIES: c-type cytochrome [Paraburkholderia]OBR48960.1 cytochrome C [Paraburkholderia tropica]PXX10044.1 cytochrome c553 [Paraburkholderia tropica]PZW74922.1 cytochrome c553 [Paraburkholderia tropica]QNB12448.1 cytochrome c4 [Paraburkholderia tropica]RQM46022.1 cytochrome c4 [Paraburkholderia bannensis]